MPEKRAVVLLIGGTPPPLGGMTIYTQLLLDSDLSQRFRYVLLRTHLPPAFEVKKTFRLLLTFKFLFQLFAILIRKRVELVHIHTSADMGFYEKALFTVICRLFQKPVILHIHSGAFGRFLEGSSFPGLISFFLNRANKVIVLSKHWYYLLASRVKMPEKKLLVLENMIDTRRYAPRETTLDREKLHVLYLGLYIETKGFFDLLEIVKKCSESKIPLVFHLAGDQLSEEARSRINEIHSIEILDHGIVSGDTKIDLFQEVDLFITPSHIEGMPLVLLEALAFGLPVIATCVGSIPEVVKEGENGMLFEVGDVDGMVAGLRSLLENPTERSKLGSNNRNLALSRFSLQERTDRLAEIYEELIDERK
jgi:glycosyltransferase involved in cell wall biosynthesis